MKSLTVITTDTNINVIDSREVAEAVEKEHKELLRTIRNYIGVLTSAKLRSLDYFIPSEYTDAKKEVRPCYLITKLGCDMVANKMTGEKGILFTAEYVKKFDQMEKKINTQIDISQLSPELQMFKQMFDSVANTQLEQQKLKRQVAEQSTKLKEQNQKLENIKEVIQLDATAWRKDTANLLNKMAIKCAGAGNITAEIYRSLRNESYAYLDRRMGVKLDYRLENMKRRMALEGASKSKINSLSKVDVIATDKKLIEGYIAIIKDMAIKYGVA